MSEDTNNIELRSEEVQEILGEVPAWILRRGITLTAIIVVVILLGSAFFKYPDVITSSVVLTSTNPAISIVAKSSGRIQHLYINDNQYIDKGSYLAVIENSAKPHDVLYLKKYLLSINSLDTINLLPNKGLEVGNLQALYSSFYLTLSEYIRFKREQYYFLKIKWVQEKIEQYKVSYQDILRQKILVEEQFEIGQKQYRRDSTLFVQKLLSEENLENSYNNYLQRKLSLENICATLNNMQLQTLQMCESLSDMEFQYSEKKNNLETQVNNYITQLITEIQNWELSYVIIAPISGQITFTQYWSINQNIASGEPIFNIVPEEKGLLMGKALLPAERSGKVKIGQTVNVSFDNFPNNEFGIVKGVIKNISLVPSEIEKKKESVEIQGVHIKAAIEEKENTLSSVTKQLEEHKEMNEEISDFRKFETKLHQMKKEIQKQNQNLEQLNQHISVNEQSIRFMDKKMEEYKETEMNYTLLKDLSDTANGEQKGKTKISFERFVQSVYFDLILAAANERLSVMSEQRYYLLRKEENDINKGSSGLELEILDEWTGKRRNVRSLSGGESFKAALSLALGLSDVIQNKKGGIQVDTIFIDEGFGTLDADSLNKAMQIINSLSLEGNKLVGIISHVDELKDQIDQKIEVYKDHAGSKVK